MVDVDVGRLRSLRTALLGAVALVLVAACSGAPSSVGPSSVGPSSVEHASAGSTAAGVPGDGPALRPGERFVDLAVPAPYTPSAPDGGDDEYRCFLMDPRLDGAAFLTGTRFRPQNAALVHHAILFGVLPGNAAAARELDARTPGEGWTCFGDDGVAGPSQWVGHWAPGVHELLLPPTLGYPMPPGSLIVMQVHYNLRATGHPGSHTGSHTGTTGHDAGTAGHDAGASDRSAVRLRLTDRTAGMTPLRTELLPAPVELPCPPGDAGPLCDRTAAVADVAQRFGSDVGGTEDGLVQRCSGGTPRPGPTQQCDHVVPDDGIVRAVGGHLHLLGRSVRIELNPGTAAARVLLDERAYDFDDQGMRLLADPVPVHSGDTLRVTCTHDATLRRRLPALSGLPPRYVVWGDGTADEMCLGLAVVTPSA